VTSFNRKETIMTHYRSLLALMLLLTLVLAVPTFTPSPVNAAGTADLGITVKHSARAVRYGATITFATTVTNLGPDTASGVVVSIGVSDSLADCGGTCPDGMTSNICELGALAPGASVTILFQSMALNSCCPENLGVAVADVSHDAETIDPNAANDSVRIEIKLVPKVR
jgi:uncharacterized repeat protein (TIGR01451 family)